MVKAQVEQVYNQLADRLQTLAARYATPLPQLTQEADALAQKVTSHLNKMGFQW